MKKKTSLKRIWNRRLKLFAEGNKLYAEGNKLFAESNKLRAEGYKLDVEGDKLNAEGDKLWADAILEVHGNIKMEWMPNGDCKLETGEIFKVKP